MIPALGFSLPAASFLTAQFRHDLTASCLL